MKILYVVPFVSLKKQNVTVTNVLMLAACKSPITLRALFFTFVTVRQKSGLEIGSKTSA